MSTVENYLYCAAAKRPSNCIQKNNMCCVHCGMREGCIPEARRIGKVIPCTRAILDEGETCEFSA